MKPESSPVVRKRLNLTGLIVMLASLAIIFWALVVYTDESGGWYTLVYTGYGVGGLLVGAILLVISLLGTRKR